MAYIVYISCNFENIYCADLKLKLSMVQNCAKTNTNNIADSLNNDSTTGFLV